MKLFLKKKLQDSWGVKIVIKTIYNKDSRC